MKKKWSEQKKDRGKVVAKELGKECSGSLMVKFRECEDRGLMLAHVSRLAEIEVGLQPVKEGARSV